MVHYLLHSSEVFELIVGINHVLLTIITTASRSVIIIESLFCVNVFHKYSFLNNVIFLILRYYQITRK